MIIFEQPAPQKERAAALDASDRLAHKKRG